MVIYPIPDPVLLPFKIFVGFGVCIEIVMVVFTSLSGYMVVKNGSAVGGKYLSISMLIGFGGTITMTVGY